MEYILINESKLKITLGCEELEERSLESERLDYEFPSLHGSEHHVCTAGIKGQNDSVVGSIVYHCSIKIRLVSRR